MAGDPLNLTGSWDGTYRYPQEELPVTPFLAEISESTGVFSGTIMEPDLYSSSPAHAALNGHRSGRSVDFTKTYAVRDKGYENPVDYVGELSEDGMSITGVWSLLHLNGTFEIHREAGAEWVRAAEVAVAEPMER